MKNKSFNQETWEKAIEKLHELGISTVHEDGTLLTGYELLCADVTGDGKVNAKDHSRLYAHINKTNLLEGYALLCADVTGDGKVNAKDHSRLYAHISKTNPLW